MKKPTKQQPQRQLKPTKDIIDSFDSLKQFDGQPTQALLVLRRVRHSKTLYTFVEVVSVKDNEVRLRDVTLEQDVIIDMKQETLNLRMLSEQ